MKGEKIEIAYIIGYGRSGSTLLSILLESSPSVFSCGELKSLPVRLRDLLHPCACGAQIADCPVWSEILGACETSFDLRGFLRDDLKYSSLARAPLTVAEHIVGQRGLQRYLHNLGIFFRTVSEHVNRKVIVDSSLNPVRGWLCTLLPPDEFDVRILHIIRDGRATVVSAIRDPFVDEREPSLSQAEPGIRASPDQAVNTRVEPPSSVALAWLISNLLASVIGSAARLNYMPLRYEDFAEEPRGSIEGVGRFLGVKTNLCIEKMINHESFTPGHLVAGNRIRFQRSIDPQDMLNKKSPDGLKSPLSFALIAGWLNRLLGYR